MDTIDGMKTFVAVTETGSFTAASQRLGISNKLVSKYIGVLEQRVGAKLLHRTTRTLSVTEEGRIYLGGCRQVLADLERLDAEMNLKGELSGTLRLSAPVTFGEMVVTPAALKFMDAHPGVTIEMHLTDRYVDLAEGGYDLAVRIGQLESSSLKMRKLGETQLQVVASPDYLAHHEQLRHPDELSEHFCIRDANAPRPNHWSFRIDGQMVNVQVNGRFVANSVRAGLALARAGKGVFLSPDVFLSDDIDAGRLVPVLRDFPSRTIGIQVVRLPSAFKSERHSAFTEALLTEIQACQR